jgi:hypothetical protein
MLNGILTHFLDFCFPCNQSTENTVCYFLFFTDFVGGDSFFKLIGMTEPDLTKAFILLCSNKYAFGK